MAAFFICFLFLHSLMVLVVVDHACFLFFGWFVIYFFGLSSPYEILSVFHAFRRIFY